MPSFKMHSAMLTDCPDVESIYKLLQAHGCPEDRAAGVADVDNCLTSVEAMLAVASEASIKQFDRKQKVAKTMSVKKDRLFVFRVIPVNDAEKHGFLEVYDGGSGAAKSVADFLCGDLAAGIVAENITIDLVSTFRKLRDMVGEAELTEAVVAGYEIDSRKRGNLRVRFADTENGLHFLDNLPTDPEEPDGDEDDDKPSTPPCVIKQIKAKWKDPDTKKLVKLTINPNGSLVGSAKEELEDTVRSVMRRLVGFDDSVLKG